MKEMICILLCKKEKKQLLRERGVQPLSVSLSSVIDTWLATQKVIMSKILMLFWPQIKVFLWVAKLNCPSVKLQKSR